MNGFKEFAERLRQEKALKSQKLRFVIEHKFEKEADFLREQIKIIDEILMELELVAEGKRKPSEVKFSWL